MGANKSKPTIILANQLFSAGESICGSVNISIPEPQSDFLLTLKLYKVESVTYLAGAEGEWFSNNNESCISETVLCSKSSINAGFYVYPFDLATQISLPGSMQTSDDCHKASISYKVVCNAQSAKGLKVKSSTEVKVKQHLQNNKSGSGSCKAQLKYLSTFSRGRSEIKVDLAKGYYEEGEIVNLQITVDNSNSEIPLKAVDVKLIRNVKFEYKSNKWEERDHKVFGYKYPVVVPSCKGLANFKTFSFAFPLDLKEKYTNGLGTSFGNIIESKYFFEVSGVFGKFSNDLKTYVPVILYPSQGKAECTLVIN